MTKLQTSLVVLLLIMHYVYPSTVHAQDRIEIFKVALNEADEINRELGKPIILNLQSSHQIPGEFHARLFRGSIAVLKSQSTDSQGCVRYNTKVLPVSGGGVIQMQSLDDPAWLNPVGDGFESEKYTVVFETGDQPSDSVIRIKFKELDKYFKYAISINLVPPETLKNAVNRPEILKSAVKKKVTEAKAYLQERREAFQRIAPSLCWGVTLMADTLPLYLNETIKVAELSPCTVSPDALIESAQPMVAFLPGPIGEVERIVSDGQ